ncbi:MAG: type II secretion system major pseudopilin GspG [Planctomycetota bacterium]
MKFPSATRAGFTVIEIMVVVVILGLLATIVATNVLPEADDAKVTKAKSDIASIKNAVERFYLKNSRLPESIRELIEEDRNGRRYLDRERVPGDPWENEYVLESSPGKRLEYVILCFGPDKESGTEDDITSKNMRE